MKIVNISQARNNFADLVNQVAYGSEQILIQKMGKPVAALVNPKELIPKRVMRKATKLPSTTAGTIIPSKPINITRVFEAIKEPYEVKSLLGR